MRLIVGTDIVLMSAASAQRWGFVASLILFAWALAVIMGPARILLIASFGNRYVVGYQHLPARKRQEKWETWVSLPAVAYIASIISGLAASLMATGRINLGMLAFIVGLLGLAWVGNIWGMQGQTSGMELEDQELPATFLAEIRATGESQVPDSALIARARAHIGRLQRQDEPEWFLGIAKLLQERYDLTSKQGPLWGYRSWHTAASEKVAVPRRAVMRVATRSPTLLLSCLAGLALLVVGIPLRLASNELQTWRGGLQTVALLALAVVPVPLVSVASKVNLMYRIRTWLAEQEDVAAADAIISDWERRSYLLGLQDGRRSASRFVVAFKVLMGQEL